MGAVSTRFQMVDASELASRSVAVHVVVVASTSSVADDALFSSMLARTLADALTEAEHAPGVVSANETSSCCCPVIAAARAISTGTSSVVNGAIAGTAIVAPFGNVTPASEVVAASCAPTSAAPPRFVMRTTARPVSPASMMPSVSHDRTASSMTIDAIEASAFSSKLSTTPSKVLESRAGETAQLPAPRRANPSASALPSAASRANAAARSASRCSV